MRLAGGEQRSLQGSSREPSASPAEDEGVQTLGESPSGALANGDDRNDAWRAGKSGAAVELAVVVPVYNERANLPVLHRRLSAVLTALGRPYEICYVDDGSTDGSLAYLLQLAAGDPHVRVVELARNCGQHAAVLAGFSVTRAKVVLTLDADLQNPPEEIPLLLDALRQGFDVVAGRRRERQDPWPRVVLSRAVNGLVWLLTGTAMHDFGCMLRGYRAHVVREVLARANRWTFVPMLANVVAQRVAEVPVAHAARQHGASKYSAWALLRLALALFAAVPALAPGRVVLSCFIGVVVGGLLVGSGWRLFGGQLVPGVILQGLGAALAAGGLCLVGAGVVGGIVGRRRATRAVDALFVIRALHGFRSGEQ